MKSDEELYYEYLAGDNKALDELLIRHEEGLTWFIRGYVKTNEDAEDLMMDTFALLISKKVRFRHNSSFKTWLYGIGRNLARNHIRKGDTLTIDDIDSFSLDLNFVNPEDDYINKENKLLIYKAISNMREEYRAVLYLYYFEGLEISLIAKVMKKNVKQIYNILARAKKQLKELLDETVSI